MFVLYFRGSSGHTLSTLCLFYISEVAAGTLSVFYVCFIFQEEQRAYSQYSMFVLYFRSSSGHTLSILCLFYISEVAAGILSIFYVCFIFQGEQRAYSPY